METIEKGAVAIGRLRAWFSNAEAVKNLKAQPGDVYVVSTPIELGRFKPPSGLFRWIEKNFEMQTNAIHHWGIVVQGPSLDSFTQYDLMSDEPVFENALRSRPVNKNIFRRSVSYNRVGETNLSDAEIKQISKELMDASPDYDVIVASCQTFVTNLLRRICNEDMVDPGSLESVLRGVGPNMALAISLQKDFYKLAYGAGKDQESSLRQLKRAVIKRTMH